jgi:hypothetical protein
VSSIPEHQLVPESEHALARKCMKLLVFRYFIGSG